MVEKFPIFFLLSLMLWLRTIRILVIFGVMLLYV